MKVIAADYARRLFFSPFVPSYACAFVCLCVLVCVCALYAFVYTCVIHFKLFFFFFFSDHLYFLIHCIDPCILKPSSGDF